MMGPYGYGGGWVWMVGGWLTMLLFWALLIVGIIALIRFATSGGTARRGGTETPLDILRRRYAAGELTKEQFEQMKRDVA